MKILVFGDSYAEGGFPEQFERSVVVNRGVSGTTIGDYSLYPVGRNCLMDRLYDSVEQIKNADVILLEYGLNDAMSVALGYANAVTVKIGLVKALDFIAQVNRNAKIYFVALSAKDEIVRNYSPAQASYIENDYLNKIPMWIGERYLATKWFLAYKDICRTAERLCNVLYMIDDVNFFAKYLSDDGLHPTKQGYKLIGKRVEQQLYDNERVK